MCQKNLYLRGFAETNNKTAQHNEQTSLPPFLKQFHQNQTEDDDEDKLNPLLDSQNPKRNSILEPLAERKTYLRRPWFDILEPNPQAFLQSLRQQNAPCRQSWHH